ncbi:N-acetylmuramoyl-L-alanine amidase [Deinococcus deserti]|uniref:Putative bifunctional protein,: N-acetylmuramoyl-L-alanine amidase Muramoylpentapeptide carboxypeptidase n=1 Tax=Deinococcus deserti (strain DSM 17065 / CIP 109153 / LMG 22923 / VCD115) TaxID=546414 RepID=C1D367_DEIDV|nr:N-acetylmuramoyl-L-alanine amidase [Deinococcus deserti]ACO47856.1 putative bifunctional protein, precursor : N-acetylmuramoyl-L-alanine amidase; Muramoylpentapeptide carboxypeptidase [Deinococcus deserti VCD115]
MNTLLTRRDLLRWGALLGGSTLLASCGLQAPPMADLPLNTQAVTAPSISSTSTWKAQAPREAITLLSARPTRIIVHHTASANVTDYSQAQAFTLARSIQQSHFDRGWIDSGQQFTISRGGYVVEGRHRSLEAAQGGTHHVRGAHCDGFNDVAVGIENEGTYMTVSPPAGQYSALVSLCAWLCQHYGIPATELYGHRDFNTTACPGDLLYGQLPQLRRDVATRLGVTVRIWPTTRSGQTGERVRSAQRLLVSHGQSLTADGSYGPATASAVSAFQSGAGLTPDGVIGSATWERLIRTVRRGDSGPAVQAAQGQLAARGYGVTADGVFGAGTESAVRSFQSSRGLTSDGIVGPNTWHALES